MDILTIFGVMIEVLLMLSITCIQTFFYYKTVGPSQKWRGLRLALAILFVTIIEAALQLVAMNVALWVSLLFLIIVILYPVFFMGGKFRERIFFGIVNLTIFMFSVLLTSSILSRERLAQYTSETSWQTLLLLCTLIITIYGILVLVITHLNTEGRRYIPRKYWTGMTLCFSIVFVGLLVVQYFNVRIEDTEKFRTYPTILSIGFLVIWLLLYFVFYFVCRYFSKTTEANALVIQNDMIERYMLRKQASDERIKVLSHDLKHSLTQWRMLVEEKGDANALQSISEYEEQLRSSLLINVENETANAVINQKYWEANQERVEFQIDGAFHKDLLMSKLDLCSLLSNLLDNAIEAAAQAETEYLRRVKLSIRRKGNLLIVMVENGYTIEPVLENGVFVTCKKDKGLHAIGMRSIHYVAEKYDGVVNNSYENNWFKATVMLRGYTIALSDEN